MVHNFLPPISMLLLLVEVMPLSRFGISEILQTIFLAVRIYKKNKSLKFNGVGKIQPQSGQSQALEQLYGMFQQKQLSLFMQATEKARIQS